MKIAAGSEKSPTEVFEALARQGADEARNDFLKTIDNLPPLQSAILKELAISEKPGAPRRMGVFSAPMQELLNKCERIPHP